MGIDKESSGIPEVDPHRVTTKVNLTIVIAVALFLVACFVIVYFLARDRSTGRDSGPLIPPPLQTPP